MRSVTSRPILPASIELGLGEAHVRRDHLAVDRVGGAHLAREDLGERRVGVGVGVEVVGEVALRVGVDREHVEPEPARRRRVSVRVSVVFPVPPFWESTAIVVAIGRDY